MCNGRVEWVWNEDEEKKKEKKKLQKGHVFKSVLSLSLPNQEVHNFFPQSEGRNEKNVKN